VLVCLSALIGWPIAFLARRARFYGDTWPPRVARFVGAGFALLALLYVVGFFGIFGDMDPVYGVPKIFFGPTPAYTALIALTPVLLILGIGVIAFAVLAWAGIGNKGRAYWTLGARLHDTVLAGAVAVVFWLLVYWQVW
jgi:hypothetical protein